MPSAILIRGQAGVGKQVLASTLAQGLLCEGQGSLAQSCGECTGCHLYTIGNHPDFRLLQPEADAADNREEGGDQTVRGKRPSVQIPVAAVRALTDLVTSASHRGRAKVVLISPAEAMHPSAANALLKMLEEPPARTHFLLVAHEPHRVLATIKSRCFQLPVQTPPIDVASAWLRDKAGERGALALAMSGYAPVSAADLVEDENFWAARAEVFGRLTDGSSDPLAAAEAAEKLEPEIVARLLDMWTYDILAIQAGMPARYHSDFARPAARIAGTIAGAALCNWRDEVMRFLRASRHPLNRRLALESLFGKYPGLSVR